jgi:hypothetical protein
VPRHGDCQTIREDSGQRQGGGHPYERKELLGLLLELVLEGVDVARIICVKPKASLLASFQQVSRPPHRDGCFPWHRMELWRTRPRRIDHLLPSLQVL